jgi:peptide/nickel transport system substrate-binding protein
MKTRKPYVAAAVFTAVAFIATGCSSQGSSPSAEDSSMTILVPNTFTSIDPAFNSDVPTGVISSLLYDRLIGFDTKTGEIQSQLAKSWEISSTSARFEIREDVVCTDGKPFTVNTVERNLKRLQDPAKPSSRVGTAFGGPSFQTKVDGQSVEVTFAKPVAFAARKIAENIALVCDAGLDDPASLEASSSGTGPYVLESATAADTYELRLRDDAAAYKWGLGGGSVTESMPRKITVRLMKDADTTVNLVNSGRADVALLQATSVGRVTGDLSKLTASTGSSVLLFNHRSQTSTETPEVRLALSQLIDREGYSQVATGGVAGAATSLTAPGAQCSANGVIQLPSGGKDSAQATLEKAGWVRTDGVWQKGGKALSVRLINVSDQVTGAEYVRTVMAEFGIDAQLDTRSGAEAVAAMREGTSWDAALISVSGDTPPLTLIQGPVPPTGNNFSAIENAPFNEAVQKATSTGDGTDCELWHEAEKRLFAQADLNPLIQSSLQYVSSKWSLGEGANVFYLNPLNLAQR